MMLGTRLWHGFFGEDVSQDEKVESKIEALARELGKRGLVSAAPSPATPNSLSARKAPPPAPAPPLAPSSTQQTQITQVRYSDTEKRVEAIGALVATLVNLQAAGHLDQGELIQMTDSLADLDQRIATAAHAEAMAAAEKAAALAEAEILVLNASNAVSSFSADPALQARQVRRSLRKLKPAKGGGV